MKYPTLLLLFISSLLFSVSSTGQKVKLKNLDVRAQYYDIPSVGLPNHINAYHIDLTYDERKNDALGYSTQGLVKSINLPGYVKVDEQIGAQINVAMDGPSGSKLELKHNDKKNKEGKTWKEYYYNVNFNMTTFLKIYDDKGALIKEYTIPYKQTNSSSKYLSTEELKEKFESHKFYVSGRSEAINSAIKDINQKLAWEYGRIKRDKKVEFETVKVKGSGPYTEYNQFNAKIEKAFAAMSLKSNANLLIDLQEPIAFWKEKEAILSGKEKQEKKLKYACQYNLALAYFWAEDLENAAHFASMVENGDYKEKSGKKLNKKIDKLKKLFTNLDLDTRHFDVSLNEEEVRKQKDLKEMREKMIAAGDIKFFPDFPSKMGSGIDTEIRKGKLYFSLGQIVDGYFAYESEHGVPDFRQAKKNRFGYLEEDKIAVITLKYKLLDSLLIDSTMFRIEDVQIEDALIKGVKLENAIVETIDSYEKTKLLIVYPPFLRAQAIFGTSNDELEPSLAIRHISREKYYATSSITGFTKTMKRIVKECPEAVAYLDEVKKRRKKDSIFSRVIGYNNIDEIRETLRIYDSCQ